MRGCNDPDADPAVIAGSGAASGHDCRTDGGCATARSRDRFDFKPLVARSPEFPVGHNQIGRNRRQGERRCRSSSYKFGMSNSKVILFTNGVD